MENKFIQIQTIEATGQTSYNYHLKNVSEALKSVRRELTSKEDYVLWLREWKAEHKLLVEAIQFFRLIKNRVKYDVAFANQTRQGCDQLQYDKKWLGRIANSLYQLRADNKALLKSGALKQMEAAA